MLLWQDGMVLQGERPTVFFLEIGRFTERGVLVFIALA
jgi:hypothetical protein